MYYHIQQLLPWARKLAKAVSLVQKSRATPMVNITLLFPVRLTETCKRLSLSNFSTDDRVSTECDSEIIHLIIYLTLYMYQLPH